jgi:predicted AlkP superfamily pyrophosphatase or phosphodiesterase
MNSVGVADAAAPLIADGLGSGASPRRFTGTTLVDWLRSKDARSRALSVSVKDRGAILPVGRSKADVYWYSPDGRFVTSRYYRDTLPGWVNRFNARHLPLRYAGRSWTLLLPESAYPERDSIAAEGNGVKTTFPYVLSDDSLEAASQLRATPYVDEVTVAFALHGVEALRLGAGDQTDLLAVSLSSTDYVGHGFGPDSREMHDQVLRDDRTIGVFLDSLYRLRDSVRVVIVLSSDHGVGTIPEIAAASTTPGATRVDLRGLAGPLRTRLRAAGVDTLALVQDQQLLLVDRAAFRSAPGLDSVLRWFADSARTIHGVRRVDRFDALLADSSSSALARRWSHQLPADAPVALVVTLDSLSTWGGNVASHGSAYDHDAHVPLIFYGAGVRPGRYGAPVRTVDLAPTLAALAGAAPGERIDGVVLRQAIR